MIPSTQLAFNSSAPAAEAFPEWPMGWYAIAESHEVTMASRNHSIQEVLSWSQEP
jgi:hypothetical protein